MSKRFFILMAGAALVAGGCARAPEKLTPEAARARGDELVKEMSKTLSGLQTFAYTSNETREEVKAGKKVETQVTRRVVIRRPNSVAFTTKGARDVAGWYDGKHLTIVSNGDKVWARGPMPPTLDEALDYLSAEYAVQMPTADLLYSSPYDALITADTQGGWVDVQTVGTIQADHLAYQQPSIDWELWVGQRARLPVRIKFVYKNAPGQPSVTVNYSEFDPAAKVIDDMFVAKIPEGYNRIKIMRHATVEAPPAAEAVPVKNDPAGKPAK